MIKCSGCGANLQIDNAFCPYCGAKNPYFEQHRKEMSEYKQEFTQTKDNVYTHTKKFTSATVSITIICILVVLNLGMIFLAANSYSIYDAFEEMKMERNYTENKQQMDYLLEQEDFIEFYNFTSSEYQNIMYICDEYREYTNVSRAANAYMNCYRYIMKYGTQDFYSQDDFNNTLSYLCDEIQILNKVSIPTEYEYDDAFTPEKVKAMEGMKKEMQVFLKSYIGLTQEEVSNIYEIDKVDLLVLLKENMTYVDKDEE